MLLEHGARIDAAGEYENRPLHLACSAGHQKVVSKLLQQGASVTAKNSFGNSPLDMATNSNIRRMVSVLTAGLA